MKSILLEPHHDDAILFSCYTLLAEKPTVITVLGGESSQPTADAERRQWESKAAMAHVGVPYAWWDLSEVKPDWQVALAAMEKLERDHAPERVWVPLVEQEDGHAQHDVIGEMALGVFGSRCWFYATYRRGGRRTQTLRERIPQSGWPSVKFRALACYISQIEIENTRPWFAADDCLREWIA